VIIGYLLYNPKFGYNREFAILQPKDFSRWSTSPKQAFALSGLFSQRNAIDNALNGL